MEATMEHLLIPLLIIGILVAWTKGKEAGYAEGFKAGRNSK